MSTQVIPQDAPERRGTAVEVYAQQVMGDEARANELFRALPKHVSPDRFQRNLVNALMQNPDMLKYDPRFVYREVSKAAALGLLLDPQLGEAYIVPVWNGKSGRQEPQLRVGYRGIIKLARQSGEISNIYAHEVHENDEIECDLGVDKRLIHKPLLFGERGAVVGYYAVVKFKDGESDFEPMTLGQIHAIRDKSDGWRAFKAGKIKSTPWSTDEGEMAKKTVIKRLSKRVPQSPDLATALSFENDASRDGGNLGDVTRLPKRPPLRTISSRLDDFAEIEAEPEPDPTDAGDAPAPASSEDLSHPESSETSAPSDGHPLPVADGADTQVMPQPLADAMEQGRLARRSNMKREAPRPLLYVKRKPEADAFLLGWDEENYEINAAENGTV